MLYICPTKQPLTYSDWSAVADYSSCQFAILAAGISTHPLGAFLFFD